MFCVFVQFDFVKLLDGKALPRSLTDPISTAKAPKGLLLSGLQETGFIEYMDPGTWHLAVYNDGRNLEQVVLHSTPIGEDTNETFFIHCLYLIALVLSHHSSVDMGKKINKDMAVSDLKMTSAGNFSQYKAEKAVGNGRTAQVVMTGLANCSSLL